MQQSDILLLAQKLIPVYGEEDFDYVLEQLTEGESPSTKILVKMELNRVMTPCKKSIDLRGRVQGECRQYQLDGISHWLDDIAFNVYHKNVRKYGTYTEGVWEALANTPNNFRIMRQSSTKNVNHSPSTQSSPPFLAESIHLGYHLQRQEKRLKVQSQIEILCSKGRLIQGLSIDLSCSGAKFKVPKALDYKLGEVLQVTFRELANHSQIIGLDRPLKYQILGIDDCYENNAIRYLRAIRLTETNIIGRIIEKALNTASKRSRHANQDKVIRARARGYEHIASKYGLGLPLFFEGNELKFIMLTNSNHSLWQYWHDERNQPALSTLFNPTRINSWVSSSAQSSSNTFYSFKHEHNNKIYFYSLLLAEASPSQRQLFWHIGARRKSWKVFRISMFELSEKEKNSLGELSNTLTKSNPTHVGFLQEISSYDLSQDYQLTERPLLSSNSLNEFRHPKSKLSGPKSFYFDAEPRRKELRYQFKTPIVLSLEEDKCIGFTIDISEKGLSLSLDSPINWNAGQKVSVLFRELQLYDKKLPLSDVQYHIIRISPDGRKAQLAIEETRRNLAIIAFFSSMIEYNQDKLLPKNEPLPSQALLDTLRNIIFSRSLSTPIFINQVNSKIRTSIIGVSYPLAKHIALFSKKNRPSCFALEALYKNRIEKILPTSLKQKENINPYHLEIYLSVAKFGDKIASIESKESKDFMNLDERIDFIKQAQKIGEFYALRLSVVPIFDPFTSLLHHELNKLTQLGIHIASKLEKELTSLIGYSEIQNITEEVLLRLALSEK
ncbi:PilZ domain-containing protein [Vibrio sagamiensis]|nr:PilZ domain-containing protein [Vibrio sagamiensis]